MHSTVNYKTHPLKHQFNQEPHVNPEVPPGFHISIMLREDLKISQLRITVVHLHSLGSGAMHFCVTSGRGNLDKMQPKAVGSTLCSQGHNMPSQIQQDANKGQASQIILVAL